MSSPRFGGREAGTDDDLRRVQILSISHFRGFIGRKPRAFSTLNAPIFIRQDHGPIAILFDFSHRRAKTIFGHSWPREAQTANIFIVIFGPRLVWSVACVLVGERERDWKEVRLASLCKSFLTRENFSAILNMSAIWKSNSFHLTLWTSVSVRGLK